MEVPLVFTGNTAPPTAVPGPEASADGGPSFDRALAIATTDADLDAGAVTSDSSLAVLAALLTLATPAAAPGVPTTPASDADAEAQSLNWALALTAADPAAAAERLATLGGSARTLRVRPPPAPPVGAEDEAAANLALAGALGQAEPDVQPPEHHTEPAAPRLRLLRELDDTPIIHNAPPSEPARPTEARPITTGIPESAVLVQVERALEALTESTPTAVRVQLQPESLGRIELRVAHGEHGLRVTLTAESAATGQLLERRLDDLRQALAAAGVEVAGLSVNVGSSQADERALLWQRPIRAILHGVMPARASGNGSAGENDDGNAILVAAHRATLAGVDYRI